MKWTHLSQLVRHKFFRPKFAQITGMVVTAIVVIGIDGDVLWAIPAGILAGAVATFFVSFGDHLEAAKKI